MAKAILVLFLLYRYYRVSSLARKGLARLQALKVDLTVDGLFDGSSPECPLILDDNVARVSYGIDNV
jgi:hypothetical protein